MNYRHSYHAGNFADVLKHFILMLCVRYIQKKSNPVCIIDTHGGAGMYHLGSDEALKTNEWQAGIGQLTRAPALQDDLKSYLDLVRGDLTRDEYPGSPVLMARLLRPLDRLIVSELHRDTFFRLQTSLLTYDNAHATHVDGYTFVRANLPPQERRGLVLIDPPYEQRNEFEVLSRQMAQWKKRWATGVYLIWYPIKAHLPTELIKEAAITLDFKRVWTAEILLNPRDQPEMLNGCGMLILNVPFSVPEQVNAALPDLVDALGLHTAETHWVVPDEA